MMGRLSVRRPLRALQEHWPAFAILCSFLVLGTIYSVIDPVFEASDELNHYPFVQHLAQGGGLPVQRHGQKTLWGQEGSQPPLYYALAAALTFRIDTSDLPTILYLNPHAERGVPLALDNKNMIVHTDREVFPWQGTVLAVHMIRLLSVLMGAGTVLCTYLLARTLFPRQPALAYGAMALNANIPMFLFISGSVNNDNLVILLASVALVILVRLVEKRASPRRLVVLGIVIGLACLSKLSALGLLPLAGLASGLPELRCVVAAGRSAWTKAVRSWIHDLLLICVPAALVAGWWYVRNWQLYGDPTGLQGMLAIVSRRPVAPTVLTLLDEFQGFRINFWGLFGGVNVLMRPVWIYQVLDGLTLLAVAGLVGWIWRARRRGQPVPWSSLVIVVGWIAIVFISFLNWTITTAASQGRLIFPALSGICLMLMLGWIGWLPERHQWGVAAGLAGLFLFLAASAPFTAIRPAYAAAPIVSPRHVPASARPVNIDYGGVVRLLAYEADTTTLRPGDGMKITLYWQALAPIREDYSVYLQLFSWPQALGQRDSYPGGGSRPTSLWSPGQIIQDTSWVPVTGTAVGPTPAWMAVGMYRLNTMAKLPATDSQGKTVVFPTLGKFEVQVPVATLLPAYRLDANLDGRVRLIGYDLPSDHIRRGSELSLTLYWQVTGKIEKDYVVFIHLVDDKGYTAGQGDDPPLKGFYPTSEWSSGEILNDQHHMVVSANAQPGTYHILAGMYDPQTGERLPFLDSAGKPFDTQVPVASLTIAQ